MTSVCFLLYPKQERFKLTGCRLGMGEGGVELRLPKRRRIATSAGFATDGDSDSAEDEAAAVV